MEIKCASKITEKYSMIQEEYSKLAEETLDFSVSKVFRNSLGIAEKIFYNSEVSLRQILGYLEIIGSEPVQMYYVIYENKPVGTMVILSSEVKKEVKFFDHRVNAFFLGYLIEKIKYILNNPSLAQIVKSVPEVLNQIELYDNYVFKGEI